ncbi:pimeloyl-ACP methyl ester carboxylesterase [Mycolicibacterium sp. BK634]|uniref:alpha/beta fold hydrolase n=1 Tax=Mycolicibacterium sp. BK634 TaxID=2587099 RepID=UPI00161A3C8A|nr:pimeloyl-ACP methyl ester carboxylesterase [Mycolicibacterium sp. BK634]
MEPRLTFGDLDDDTKPLAVLVHGFPDTPHTWRLLGPALVDAGYRVVAPWLPGYREPATAPVSVGTYVRHILTVRDQYRGDERSILIGHDWGANAGYGAVVSEPAAFRRFVALAVPPTAALGGGLFSYRQLRRSFYIWFIQQVGLAEFALLERGFWESLWADWSPGYACEQDVAMLREYVTADTISGVLGPYRASFNPDFVDPATADEAAATIQAPPVPTYYLHGSADGAIGAELLMDVSSHLPAPGSTFDLVDGAGHFLHLDQPELVAGKILDWLGD